MFELGATVPYRFVFLLIGGFLTTSEIVMGASGYCFISLSLLCLYFSSLSHLVTSKDALACCSLSSCLKFSIINSLSFIRFLSPFRLEIEREWGLTLIVLVRMDTLPPLADRVDLLDFALPDLYRNLALPAPPLSEAEKALPTRSLGTRFAC